MASSSRPIQLQVTGRLFAGSAGLALLLEPPPAPAVYLRLALVTLGPEEEIFPSLVLDDWGQELTGPKVYSWIREQGARFPRAEVFGQDPAGRPEQCFLRALELHATLPCYVATEPEAPPPAARRLAVVAVPEPTREVVESIDPTERIGAPLRFARVTWWTASPAALAAAGYSPVELG